MFNTESDFEHMRNIFTIEDEDQLIDEIYEFVESTFPEPDKHNALTAIMGLAAELGGGPKVVHTNDVWERTNTLFTLHTKELPNLTAAIGLLAITNSWKPHLPARSEFITKCKEIWNKPDLFDGFE